MANRHAIGLTKTREGLWRSPRREGVAKSVRLGDSEERKK